MQLVDVTCAREGPRPGRTAPPASRALLGTCALLFIASAAMTIGGIASMSSMGAMPMPGGWTMSMAWMRMPEQTWPGVASSFVAMWVVMMMAMMLPSLVPMLLQYRDAVSRTGTTRLGRLTALVGAAYFLVWSLFGVAAFVSGAALAAVAMHVPAIARAVPLAVGVVVLFAGALQFTAWKRRQLGCCRAQPSETLPANARTAWRHGLDLGVRCVRCCFGLTAILLAVGVMDVPVMALVTAAITAERLVPAGALVARGTGVVIVCVALQMIAQAVGIV